MKWWRDEYLIILGRGELQGVFYEADEKYGGGETLIKGAWQMIGCRGLCENKAFRGQLRTYSVLSMLFHVSARWEKERGASESARTTFRKSRWSKMAALKLELISGEKWMTKMNTLLDNEAVWSHNPARFNAIFFFL